MVSIPSLNSAGAHLPKSLLRDSHALQMQAQIGYSQPYGQPGYNDMQGSFQNGVQQHQRIASNVPQTQAQHQLTQHTDGQPSQQAYAQQAYGQQVQSTQAYGQQSVYPPYGQQGVQQGVQRVFQQMPGQQVVQAPAAIVGAQYCAQGEQIFFVNEKWASLSRDDFSILDSHKQPVLQMDSSVFSVKQKRVLKTTTGKAVCSLKKKVVSHDILKLRFPAPISDICHQHVTDVSTVFTVVERLSANLVLVTWCNCK